MKFKKKSNYCTHEVRAWLKGKTGQKHPSFKHGKSKGRNSCELEYWRRNVFQYYQWTCFLTHTKTDLICHHLNGWNLFPNQRYDISNGVVLTQTVHKHFHKLYGNGNNTKEQFEEYCKTYYQIIEFPWRYGNHEPSISAQALKKKQQTFRDKQFAKISEIARQRQHIIQKGNYETLASKVWILCRKHNYQYQTTFGNYQKSLVGIPCCSKERQRTALQDRYRDSKGRVL